MACRAQGEADLFRRLSAEAPAHEGDDRARGPWPRSGDLDASAGAWEKHREEGGGATLREKTATPSTHTHTREKNTHTVTRGRRHALHPAPMLLQQLR